MPAPTPPAEPSVQLRTWLGPVRNGFKPKGKLAELDPAGLADFFKVDLWEYENVLAPLIAKQRQPWQDEDFYAAAGERWAEISKFVLKLKHSPLEQALTPAACVTARPADDVT